MRLCLIQTVKLFLITGLNLKDLIIFNRNAVCAYHRQITTIPIIFVKYGCESYKTLINLRMPIAKIFSYNYNRILMLKRNVWAQ